MIDPTDKPYWMTEGGTGSHDWPEALHDVGGMLHNALTVGNAAAVVPWQIAGAEPSEHNLMLNDGLTAKSHVAQHYFRFIRPGAVRIGLDGTDPRVPASAYLHEADGTLTVVLTNPGNTAVDVFLPLPESLRAMSFISFRTLDDEDAFKLFPVGVLLDGDGASVKLTLPGPSIVTLIGRF